MDNQGQFDEMQAQFEENVAKYDRATRISMWVFRATLAVMIGLTVYVISQSPTINECTNAHPNELTVSEPNGRNER